jgi:hypothetical protein
MGSLKPGVKYIYEQAGGVTYAREFGALPNERFPIGWDYEYRTEQTMRLWVDILKAAETNPSLQSELDRVKVIYELSKTDE